MIVRRWCVLAHRYVGLFMAAFLIVVGATGAVLAFKDEIDGWLNPDLHQVAHREAPMLDPFALRERALALSPGARIDEVQLFRKPDAPYAVKPSYDHFVQAAHEMDGERLVIDPYSGNLIRRVPDGIWPITRENAMEFIDRLHYSLVLGDFGTWLLGVVALLWTLDCFVGLILTLPACSSRAQMSSRRSWWRKWQASWTLKRGAAPYRRYYDWHRAGGLWLWPVLLIFAWSSVYFNLGEQIYLPVMKAIASFDDTYDRLPDVAEPKQPILGWREAYAVGQRLVAEQAAAAGIKVEREDNISYDAGKNVFFFTVLSDRDVSSTYAGTNVIFDGSSGSFIAFQAQTGTAAGNTLTAWLVAIHLAAFGGLPMQSAIALVGLLATMLSATGVYLWLRKRRARWLATLRHWNRA